MIVTTPGSASANSYADADFLQDYLASRIPAVVIASGSEEPYLVQAARVLDAAFAWTGTAVDGTQALAWPRVGMLTRNGYAIPETGTDSIPVALKQAQCELAVQMKLGDRLSDNDTLKQGITSVKAGSVAVTFKEIDESTVESADIAVRKLEPELAWAGRAIPDAVRLLLVASWYLREGIMRSLIFGAM